MDKISRFNVVHRYEKRALLIAINCVGSLAIFFFGYDQGMMGSVNVSIDYAVNVMKLGHVEPGTTQVVTDRTLMQGGIVSHQRLTSYNIRLLSADLCILSGLSRWLFARRLDCREDRTNQSHRTRIHLGRLWGVPTMLGAEHYLDDFR